MIARRIALPLAIFAAAAPSAAAQEPLPRDNPAIDEYVPSLPAAPGDKAVGTGGREAPPPPEVQAKLDQSPEREILKRLASDEAVHPGGRRPESQSSDSAAPASKPDSDDGGPGVIGALASSLASSGDPAPLILVAGLLAGTVAAAAAVRARRS